MPPEAPTRYRFTGHADKGYYSYAAPESEGGMLLATPGQTYTLRALEDHLPVPPTDGQWEAVASGGKGSKGSDKGTEGGEQA